MTWKWFAGGCLVALVAIVAPAPAPAQSDGVDAVALMKTAHVNLYYAGQDGRARVHMTLTGKNGKSREREFIMYRLDTEEDGGEQKYYTYFLSPSDVRRIAFMVWKDPKSDDARWIYIPAVDLVRRVSARDKSSSFVGSDFSYEDVSGRHWSDDAHTLVGEEELDGVPCYVVDSTPREEDAFARKRTWIRKEHMLPVREVYYGTDGEEQRVFEAKRIETIDGYPTIVERRMTNVQNDHRTDVVFSDVAYDVGVESDLFTERYLKSPPAYVRAQ